MANDEAIRQGARMAMGLGPTPAPKGGSTAQKKAGGKVSAPPPAKSRKK